MDFVLCTQDYSNSRSSIKKKKNEGTAGLKKQHLQNFNKIGREVSWIFFTQKDNRKTMFKISNTYSIMKKVLNSPDRGLKEENEIFKSVV